MYKLELKNSARKDIKKLKHRKKSLQKLSSVIETLRKGEKLAEKYKNHKLLGKYNDLSECHIGPDLLLIYKIEKQKLVIILIRIGSHSELF
jgi:mRNA interferase YafQ